jgi:signal transduction histidine kinase
MRAEAELERTIRDASPNGSALDVHGSATADARARDVHDAVSGSEPAATPVDTRPLVLAVEDEEQVARTVARILEPQFRVVLAPDGLVGLARALELRPDLILTDMMMPRMTGAQLVREVRKRKELDGIPIILLTAFAEDDLRVRMLREGAIDYITKPFSMEELLSRVENVVAMKRARELLQEELHTRDRDVEALAGELVLRKRQLEGALEAAQIARDRAEAANRAKSDFLGLVTHELMTPVTALRLTCQRLLRDRATPLAPSHATAVDRMTSVCTRLGSAIQSLLEHARFESGSLAVEREEVDVRALASEVLDELRPQAEHKGLALELHVEPPLTEQPIVPTDRRLLRLVLTNLASNAVKFTERGSVMVTLANAESEGANGWRMIVEDTGPGIPEADRPRIFEPFQQLEPLRHKHNPGIGLGLALAREMVEALEGRISVASGAQGGSRFTVHLPLATT